VFTNHCTPREGFQGAVSAESESEAEQRSEARAGSRNSSPSATQHRSCNLCPASAWSQRSSPAPGRQPPHSTVWHSGRELGHGTSCAKKSITVPSSTAFQERCFVTLEPKSTSSSTVSLCSTLRSGREMIRGHQTGTAYWQPPVRPQLHLESIFSTLPGGCQRMNQ